jgi:hypothetical protein
MDAKSVKQKRSDKCINARDTADLMIGAAIAILLLHFYLIADEGALSDAVPSL